MRDFPHCIWSLASIPSANINVYFRTDESTQKQWQIWTDTHRYEEINRDSGMHNTKFIK